MPGKNMEIWLKNWKWYNKSFDYQQLRPDIFCNLFHFTSSLSPKYVRLLYQFMQSPGFRTTSSTSLSEISQKKPVLSHELLTFITLLC